MSSKLEEFYVALNTAGTFLNDERQRNFSEICQDLGMAAQRRGALRWQIRPKMHRMLHFPLLSASISPRAVSCLADETHIGTICNTWKRSVAGRCQANAQFNVLHKRLLGVLLRFELGMF